LAFSLRLVPSLPAADAPVTRAGFSAAPPLAPPPFHGSSSYTFSPHLDLSFSIQAHLSNAASENNNDDSYDEEMLKKGSSGVYLYYHELKNPPPPPPSSETRTDRNTDAPSFLRGTPRIWGRCVCACVCVCVCVFVYMHVYPYACVYVVGYVCGYIYMYIYTGPNQAELNVLARGLRQEHPTRKVNTRCRKAQRVYAYLGSRGDPQDSEPVTPVCYVVCVCMKGLCTLM
jgi:hypothetical protein